MNDASLESDAAASRAALRRILTAAWLAVIAGVLVQLLVVGARASAGGAIEAAGFFAEMAQGLTWSALVCAAIAVGTLTSKSRARIAGFIGLLAGPLAWAAAKGVQKGVQALAGAPQDSLTPLFWTVCGWKGVEYATLGVGIALLVRRPDARLRSYLMLGFAVGAASACVVLGLNVGNASLAGASVPAPRLASIVANEVFFPCACATVIYAAQALTRHVGALRP